MGKPIDLAGFEAVFRDSPDPWKTRTSRDERVKREAILRALGTGRRARVLELASGNGSNSSGVLSRSLRLHACDGAEAAVALTRAALGESRRGARADVTVARLPGGVPADPVEAVVIAEVLYYLPARDVRRLGQELARRLQPGGRLVLAHHGVDFHDTASRPQLCHTHLLEGVSDEGRNVLGRRTFARTSRWRVERVDVA